MKMWHRVALTAWLLCTLVLAAQAQQPNFPSTLLDLPPLGTEQDLGTTAFTALTPSATANTKGAYTQLVASSSNPTKTLVVNWKGAPTGTVSKSFLIDIATGGSGSEVVYVPNLTIGVTAQFGVAMGTVAIPVNIPAGTRIAARTQTNGTSSTDTAGIKLNLFTGGFGGVGVDAIGANTATSLGTAITPGNGTKSAYVQLIASSAHTYKGVFLYLDPQSAQSGDFTDCFIDLATGGGGSEIVFYDNYPFQFDGTSMQNYTMPYLPLPAPIPAGTRFAARIQCSNTQAAIGASLYGIY